MDSDYRERVLFLSPINFFNLGEDRHKLSLESAVTRLNRKNYIYRQSKQSRLLD